LIVKEERTMQIFSVFFHPSTAFTALGGAEKRLVRVLEHWTPQRVFVTVVDSNLGFLSSEHGKREVVGIQSPIHVSGKGIFSIYLEWVLWVVKACFLCPPLVRRRRYDCILASSNTLPNIITAYVLHRISKIKLCVVVHHVDFPYVDRQATFLSVYSEYRKAQFNKLASFIKAVVFVIMLWLLKRADCCIAVSEYTANVLLRNHVLQSKVKRSDNGVDVNLIDSVKASEKQHDGVFVGRIMRDKGIFDLVQAWKHISFNWPNVQLLIIGSGPDFSELRSVVRNSGMASRIVLKGNCEDSEMYRLMKASRLFVLPSRFEGWGLAVGEALACGLPVVCYDIPALREVFGECRSVFFTPVGDTARLARAIEEILKTCDLSELEKTSREYVKRFSWNAIASKDLEILRTLIQSARDK
jgi:glycosyltransferase involved in cell wall biosynthesis